MLVENGLRVLWLARTGWMQSGIPPSLAETVSQHTFLASLIALDLFNKMRNIGKKIDENVALKMIILHDLAEGLSGDLPKWTSERISKEELEEEALSKIKLPEDLAEVVREYMRMETLEAKVARLADLMATWRMAIYYKQLGFETDDIMNSSQRESIKLAKEIGIYEED